ncbi:uncharacterized protein PAS_chr1-3_0257 [Komagataella phaffii GS115]|uniref:3-methyl-adenine DNA glycosylase involved in protecting DNA against alkylating agents n=1 Tax=Komagataella phaffii (strain GS115 / ATCC 20864) TaxID=644223 RepID=C4QVP8_KOMPG|nr:uncharacterized protein PAS_chr1-3_0257 [Komagataella phaffii GS115]CAY67321.1 3-methyl-adenine DNA glycosylase involved in protecting DNA against alkylating agents [Komagataella phaffii GS115]
MSKINLLATRNQIKIRKAMSKRSIRQVKAAVANGHTNGKVSAPPLALPTEFISYHDAHFIKAVEHLLKIDNTLYDSVVQGPFERFKKKRQILLPMIWATTSAGGELTQYRLVAEEDATVMRGLGLSARKVQYTKDIARAFIEEEDSLLEFFFECSEEELFKKMIAWKGIGPWSVTMFSVFSLNKMDCFTVLDLGVVRGASKYLQARPELLAELKDEVAQLEKTKKKKAKKQAVSSNKKWIAVDEQIIERLAERFQPYRTALMVMFWRIGSVDLQVLES